MITNKLIIIILIPYNCYDYRLYCDSCFSLFLGENEKTTEMKRINGVCRRKKEK